ncbi:aminotransferase class I/II-fold pyridoxal phosphate-dependent enzyme [Micromonospora sp. NPDC047740]|uniref:aminotransferase class I/II-fold pyridoxal phosphate-dependent enzyme n=1 Tax=Micromonospora sp. NPDC047740 TaxID=3364254 RepID=UPI00371E165F
MTILPMPESLQQMSLPEMADRIGTSVRAAERELEQTPGPAALLDVTYADTHRFPPPSWALDTFVEAASGKGMTYTPYRGDRQVRAAVAANVESVLGIPSHGTADVILTPGTQGALFVAMASILQPGDLVVLPDPEYLSTERMLRYFGARVARVPMVEVPGDRPEFDWEVLEDLFTQRPRLMIFSHPNNPTGAVYSAATIARIAELARANDVLVLADELYCRLVYDNEPFVHLACLPGMASRTITLLGPSKTESLSGYRLGIAVAPTEIVDRMEDVQSLTALRAPAYAQHLLTRWLAEDVEFLKERILEYQALRDSTVQRLNESGLLTVVPAYGSAYLFPKLLVGATDQQVAIALKQDAGIVVNPGYQFGTAGLGHLRLCFAQDEPVWSAALDRLLTVVGRFG